MDQCYICGTDTKFFGQRLKAVKIKHSDSTICDVLVKLARRHGELGACISRELNDTINTHAVCCECLQLIDEYDLACITARRIERQLYDKLSNTKLKLQNSQVTEVKCERPNTYYFEDAMVDKDDAFDVDSNGHFDDNNFDWEPDTISIIEPKVILSEMETQLGEHIIKQEATSLVRRLYEWDNKYKCDICQEEFSSKYKITQHMKFHACVDSNERYQGNLNIKTEDSYLESHSVISRPGNALKVKEEKADDSVEKPFKCSRCSLTFAYISSLNMHFTEHRREDNKHKCKICFLYVKNENELPFHKELHKNMPVAQCVICMIKFKSIIYVRSHVLAQHQEHFDNINCLICGHLITSKEALNNHMELHSRVPNLQCVFCNTDFDLKRSLMQHVALEHDRVAEKLKCPICTFKVIDEKDFNEHRALHDNFGATQCVICELAFENKLTRNLHMRDHEAKNSKDTSTSSAKDQAGKRRFVCSVCGESCSTKAKLQYHERIHTGVLPKWAKMYPCDQCGKVFHRQGRLDKHVSRYHDEKDKFKCEICHFQSKTDEEILSHRNAHRDVLPNKCIFCFKITCRPTDLRKHVQRKHQDRDDVKCIICSFTIPKSDVKMHMDLHSQLSKYQCVLCKLDFPTRSKLVIHVADKHMHKKVSKFGEFNKFEDTVNKLKCKICKFVLQDETALNEHEELHKSLDPKQCAICKVKFSNRGNRDTHMLTHYDMKTEHLCETCGKVFYHKNTLRNHILSHHREKRYACDICNLKFVAKAKLQLHLNTHLKLKPYSCKICGNSFSNPYNMRVHVQEVHSGERNIQYKCTMCERSFQRKYKLREHLEKTHNILSL